MKDRHYCLNCNQKLLDQFCHHCGQENINVNLTFSELVRDFLGDMFTYDSRFYRTMLPLIFRPGFLTKEYFVGRRIRYVPPLRLYLFVSFILFLWLALVDKVEVGEPPDFTVAQENRERIISELQADDKPEWVITLADKTMQALANVMANPAAFIDLISSRLPYLMFILLPIFALILWLHYCFSGLGYLRHLVLAFHFHTFVYTLFLVFSIIDEIVEWEYAWLIFIAINVYIAIALRRAYDSSRASAILKTLSILFFYFVVLGNAFSAFLFVNVLGYS